MGRQLNFYLHPDDQADFDNMLKSRGDIIIVPYYHHTDKISTVSDTIMRDASKEGARVYLVRPQDFLELRLEYFEQRNFWLVDDSDSPVLHFDRCVFRSNELGRGRLYFQPNYVKNLQWINKSEEFVKWADSIISRARRKLEKRRRVMGKYIYTDYVGKHALTWIQEHQPQPINGGLTLKF